MNPGGAPHGRRASARRGATLALLCGAIGLTTAVPPHALHAQAAASRLAAQRAALSRIASEENARGATGLAAVMTARSHADPVVRQAAVRALGRLQSARHLDALLAALDDVHPAVRREAVTAVGQALQEYRRPGTEGSADKARATTALTARVVAEPALRGVAARTAGRLPWSDSLDARRGEAAILAWLGSDTVAVSVRALPAERLEGVLHGLYTLARARRTLGSPHPAAIAVMRAGVGLTRGETEDAARVRRLALLGLMAAGQVTQPQVERALSDGDEQVRRLSMVAQAALADSAVRLALVRRGLRDPSPLVRHEAVRAWRAFVSQHGCNPLLTALDDRNAHVTLAALDGIGASCGDADRIAGVLERLITTPAAGRPAAARAGVAVDQRHARTLLALARVAPQRATGPLRQAAAAQHWALRMHAARAAALLRDTSLLRTLAGDAHGNVSEAALEGLHTVSGHAADPVFVSALASPHYHVVLQAATALRGSPTGATLVEPLLAALSRITGERRETSRDPRMEILARLSEFGGPRHAAPLEPLRFDFDSTVARRAAEILSAWQGRAVTADPRPLPRPDEAIEELLAGRWRARVTMAGGASFEVALFPREAPFTTARFVRLARAGYYDGLTFHRVEPGFVIQGGSPAANEYVGDGPFMRDELGARSHTRGTLGISTRGRDTGDAQMFVNLVDNFRLDYEYTVFGEVMRGRTVVESVLAGDVIERISIVRLP